MFRLSWRRVASVSIKALGCTKPAWAGAWFADASFTADACFTEGAAFTGSCLAGAIFAEAACLAGAAAMGAAALAWTLAVGALGALGLGCLTAEIDLRITAGLEDGGQILISWPL